MRLLTVSTVLLALATNSYAGSSRACTYPQPCWPSESDWNSLNATLQGFLVRARPPAYPCHPPNLDETQCQIVKQNWTNELWRAQQPGAYFDAAWENGDSYCNIDNNSTVPCDQGLVPIYVAQVKSVADVQTAVKFAKKHKISTRVKGASHDFLGRSSGNGTFGIQTINLRGIDFDDDFKPYGAPNNVSPQPVVHIAAGEIWYRVYEVASERGVVVVGGESYSVGAAGGWVLGGGHSPLSPQYGLGVDNVIEFEIVTPDGELRKANTYKNKDLFWALRGGGPGFGVVTKVTYRTHPAITSTVTFNMNIKYTPASYRGLLKTYLLLQPTFSARNYSGYARPVTPDPSTNSTMFVAKVFAFNFADLNGVNSTLKPLYDFIESETSAGRPMNMSVQSRVLTDYFQLWDTPIDQIDEGAGRNAIMGSRLLPISLFEDGEVDPLVDLLAQSQSIPSIVLVGGGKVSNVAPGATAVQPSWRRSTHHLVLGTGWLTDTPFSTRQLIRTGLTQEIQKLAALVPSSGSYVNEGDINEPSWRETFWGSNYEKLAGIKKTVDPLGMFTCYHCVGDDSD
ncbi:FAD-binding domain-containing protein [Serendipita vermifera]|nr:FAD-binding domain-containing protein [Serendipita vermifera]